MIARTFSEEERAAIDGIAAALLGADPNTTPEIIFEKAFAYIDARRDRVADKPE